MFSIYTDCNSVNLSFLWFLGLFVVVFIIFAGITCQDMPCSGNADCNEVEGGFVCKCKEGFFGLGQTCFSKEHIFSMS